MEVRASTASAASSCRELLPHLAEVVDDITRHPLDAHRRQQPRPVDQRAEHRPHRRPAGRCSGSWLTYGLGSREPEPAGLRRADRSGRACRCVGVDNWSNGWLPSLYQGTVVRPQEPRILNLDPPPHLQGRAAGALSRLPRASSTASTSTQHPGELDLEARIASYELAARMQTAAKEALDISQRDARRRRQLYGLDDPATRGVRHALPDRPPAGRARRALRAGLHRQPVLGPPRRASARRCPPRAARPTSRPRRWSRT